jgi:hypothetical protein
MHVYGISSLPTFGYVTVASLTLNRQALRAAALNMAGMTSALGALLSMNPTFETGKIIKLVISSIIN